MARSTRQRAASRRNLVKARRKRIAKGVLTVGVAAGAVYGGHKAIGGEVNLIHGKRMRYQGGRLRHSVVIGDRMNEMGIKTGGVQIGVSHKKNPIKGRTTRTRIRYGRGKKTGGMQVTYKTGMYGRRVQNRDIHPFQRRGTRSSKRTTYISTASILVRGR